MSSSNQPLPRTPYKSSASTSNPTSPFLQQRDALVGEIAIAMEHVLQNINKLNRSLEGVIAVGNEFGAVEALWSQFENVMAKEPEQGENGEAKGQEGAEEGKEDAEGKEDEEDAQDGAKEEQRR